MRPKWTCCKSHGCNGKFEIVDGYLVFLRFRNSTQTKVCSRLFVLGLAIERMNQVWPPVGVVTASMGLESSQTPSKMSPRKVYKPLGLRLSLPSPKQLLIATNQATLQTTLARNMSLPRFVYEPFYTLSDFDRLFDEAFSARANGNANSGNQLQRRDTQESTGRSLRPR